MYHTCYKIDVYINLLFSLKEYRNLCETITRRVEIADPDYEYQPPHYHEVYCKSYSLLDNNERMITKPSQVNLDA